MWALASYIPSKRNKVAHIGLPQIRSNLEWILAKGKHIWENQKTMGNPGIDLIASMANFQGKIFILYYDDSMAIRVDAFPIPWGGFSLNYRVTDQRPSDHQSVTNLKARKFMNLYLTETTILKHQFFYICNYFLRHTHTLSALGILFHAYYMCFFNSFTFNGGKGLLF